MRKGLENRLSCDLSSCLRKQKRFGEAKKRRDCALKEIKKNDSKKDYGYERA